MPIVGIFFVAEIFKQVILNVARLDKRALVSQPIEKLRDKMKMLSAVERHLLLGQLALGPQFEKRMIFTVLFVAGSDQLIVKRVAHNSPPTNLASRSFDIFRAPVETTTPAEYLDT